MSVVSLSLTSTFFIIDITICLLIIEHFCGDNKLKPNKMKSHIH